MVKKITPVTKQHTKSLIKPEATKLKETSKAYFYLRLDFTYLDVGKQCFSEWENLQLQKLSRYITQFRQREIKDILITSSGNSCTDTFNTYMSQFKDRFSEEILPIKNAKHLYIGGKGSKERLHGFTQSNVFYVIQLDRNHDINS